MELQELYNRTVREHSIRPHNFLNLKKNPQAWEKQNPECGDTIRIFLQWNSQEELEIAFDMEGCAVSTASASMMTDIVKGKKKQEVEKIYQEVLDVMKGSKEANLLDTYGDLSVFKGILAYPVRLQCAIFPWKTLQDIIEKRYL